MIWDDRARGVLDCWTDTRIKLSVDHAIEAALSRIDALEAAIRKHRDQKSDDRCWMDDYALYGILDPTKPPYDSRLPPECEFLESCRRFWRQRQCPSDKVPLDPSTMTIAQLEAKIAEQAAVIAKLLAACRGIDRLDWRNITYDFEAGNQALDMVRTAIAKVANGRP